MAENTTRPEHYDERWHGGWGVPDTGERLFGLLLQAEVHGISRETRDRIQDKWDQLQGWITGTVAEDVKRRQEAAANAPPAPVADFVASEEGEG